MIKALLHTNQYMPLIRADDQYLIFFTVHEKKRMDEMGTQSKIEEKQCNDR